MAAMVDGSTSMKMVSAVAKARLTARSTALPQSLPPRLSASTRRFCATTSCASTLRPSHV